MSRDTLQYFGQQFLRKLVDLRISMNNGSLVDPEDFNMCCAVVQNLLEFEVQCQVPCKIPDMKIPTSDMLSKTKHSEFKRLANIKKLMIKSEIRFAGIIRCGKESLVAGSSDFAPKFGSDCHGNYFLSVNLIKPPFAYSENVQFSSDLSDFPPVVGSNTADLLAMVHTSVIAATSVPRSMAEVLCTDDQSSFFDSQTDETQVVPQLFTQSSSQFSYPDPEDDSEDIDKLWFQSEVSMTESSILCETSEKKDASTQTRIVHCPFGLDFSCFE